MKLTKRDKGLMLQALAIAANVLAKHSRRRLLHYGDKATAKKVQAKADALVRLHNKLLR